MGPLYLAFATHEQEVAVAQREVLGAPIGVAAHGKIAGGTQTEADDKRVGAKLGFVVAVPAHGVLAVAVQISQDGIGFDAEVALKTVAKGFEFWAPSEAIKRAVGVGVANSGVALKKGEPRLGNFAAKHANASLGPVAARFELGQQGVGLGRREPALEVGERTHFHSDTIQSRVSLNGLN